jgi:hypothetical protein
MEIERIRVPVNARPKRSDVCEKPQKRSFRLHGGVSRHTGIASTVELRRSIRLPRVVLVD